MAVGASDSASLGKGLGALLGVTLGLLLGRPEGLELGMALGFALGNEVGNITGTGKLPIGMNVGDVVVPTMPIYPSPSSLSVSIETRVSPCGWPMTSSVLPRA